MKTKYYYFDYKGKRRQSSLNQIAGTAWIIFYSPKAEYVDGFYFQHINNDQVNRVPIEQCLSAEIIRHNRRYFNSKKEYKIFFPQASDSPITSIICFITPGIIIGRPAKKILRKYLEIMINDKITAFLLPLNSQVPGANLIWPIRPLDL